VSELAVGPSDVVVASVWWSALQAQRLVEEAGLSPFVYLVQDYEPLFYPASSEFALAHSTYGLPCVPLVNSATLLDCLRDQHTGWFADGAAAADAIVFEPRPDPDLFFPDASERDATRRLLFYSRPHRAPRNLYEIGLAAVRAAARAGAFAGWELLAIGEPQEPASVGQDLRLDPVPWLSYPDYAALVRSSDVMLAPMLSPHPGHPTLDMAVAGGRAVTTSFGPKQADAFDWARGSVVAVDPTVDALSRALVEAAARGDEVDAWRREGRRLELPGESLDEVIPAVLASAAFSRTA
jgi:hypothetical protein